MSSISIVIPIYDVPRARLLACIENVASAFPDDEIVISDNSPAPTSAQVVEEFSRDHKRAVTQVIYSHNAPLFAASRPSRAVALNVGARLSSGDTLLFLHSDVKVPTDARERLLHVLGDEQIVAGGFLKQYNLDPCPVLLAFARQVLNLRARVLKAIVGTNAVFVRREVFLMRPFRDQFLEDFEYADWLRHEYGRQRVGIVADTRVLVGADRYREGGLAKRMLINLSVLAAYRFMRLHPDQLRTFYSQSGRAGWRSLLWQWSRLLMQRRRSAGQSAESRSAPAVVVFAKLPEPGKVKTRLTRLKDDQRGLHISATDAARLYSAFLTDLTRRIDCVVAETLDTFVSFSFDELQRWRPQHAGRVRCYGKTYRQDLGASMRETIKHFLAAGYPGVILLNSDTPHLDLSLITRAAQDLCSSDLVLGPDHRGGCYLIGMSSDQASDLLTNVPWSTGKDFATVADWARARNFKVAVLPEQYDVDEAEDVERLAADLTEQRIDPELIPATAAVVRELITRNALIW